MRVTSAWYRACPDCGEGFRAVTIDPDPLDFARPMEPIVMQPGDMRVTCWQGHEWRVDEAIRDTSGTRYRLLT